MHKISRKAELPTSQH